MHALAIVVWWEDHVPRYCEVVTLFIFYLWELICQGAITLIQPDLLSCVNTQVEGYVIIYIELWSLVLRRVAEFEVQLFVVVAEAHGDGGRIYGELGVVGDSRVVVVVYRNHTCVWVHGDKLRPHCFSVVCQALCL